MKQALTFDELIALLHSGTARPDEMGWDIYRYLSANLGKEELSSEEARRLLLIYMKLPLQRPSLLHSMMLSVALKMSELYPDFKLPGFLHMWDLHHLRPEDSEQQKGENGRLYSSLTERLVRSTLRYLTLHPDEECEAAQSELIDSEAQRMGFLPIQQMVAVKMHESMSGQRKMRFVKLVGPQGEELSADWHLFHAKPWEIVGRMYHVLSRRSAETGKLRVDTIAPSSHPIEEIFGRRIGFVDHYDEAHKHYHLFTPDSLHLVAESPRIRPTVGGYVWLSPIIPAKDKFKSAIILRNEAQEAGRKAFGLAPATVTFINQEKNFFAFQTTDGRTGFGDLTLSPTPLSIGQQLSLILYLRRPSKEGEKRLHVGEVVV